MKNLFLIILLVCPASLFAQTQEDSLTMRKVRYFFDGGFGMVFCSGCDFGSKVAPAISVIQGAEFFGRWRLGAGISYTALGPASALPLYGSLSGDLFGKKNKLFVEFNYGGALVRKPREAYTYYESENVNGPVFIQALLGYSIRPSSGMRVNVRVGHQFLKTVTTTTQPVYYDYTLFAPPIPASTETRVWKSSRLVVQLSLAF